MQDTPSSEPRPRPPAPGVLCARRQVVRESVAHACRPLLPSALCPQAGLVPDLRRQEWLWCCWDFFGKFFIRDRIQVGGRFEFKFKFKGCERGALWRDRVQVRGWGSEKFWPRAKVPHACAARKLPQRSACARQCLILVWPWLGWSRSSVIVHRRLTLRHSVAPLRPQVVLAALPCSLPWRMRRQGCQGCQGCQGRQGHVARCGGGAAAREGAGGQPVVRAGPQQGAVAGDCRGGSARERGRD